MTGYSTFVNLRYNLAKYMIIIDTDLGGAALTIVSLLLGIVGMSVAEVFTSPLSFVLAAEPIWIILFLVKGVAGIILQWRATINWEAEIYENRI